MGPECRQEKITLQGRAGGEVGPGLGYREVKRREEEAEYPKLGILAEGTSHVVSMLQDSQHSPPPPLFALVPFPFIQTSDPRESPHWAVTPGAGSILGDPNCHGGWRFEATDTTNLRGAEILRRLTHHSQLGRKENTWDGSKSSSQVLYEHDYQILANSVAGHGLKHQQKY